MVEYKDRLAKAMKEAGKSTSALATELKVTYQAIDKVLKGNTKELTASNNSKAAKFLEVDTDWLATGKGFSARTPQEITESAPAPAGLLSVAEVIDLITLYAHCDAAGRERIMRTARSAVDVIHNPASNRSTADERKRRS